MSTIVNKAYQIDENWSIVAVNKCGSSMLEAQCSGLRTFGTDEELPTKGGIFIIRHPLERLHSYWRDFVYRTGRMPSNHYLSIKCGPRPDFEHFVFRVVNTPDGARNPHFCSYQRFTACAEVVEPVALENIAGTWPEGVEMPFDPGKKVRVSPKAALELSDELVERVNLAFAEDFALWESAMEKIDE